MDIDQFRQVVRENGTKLIVIVVVSLLAALALYGRPGWNGGPSFSPRGESVWRSESIVALTELNFPWGRAIPKYRASNAEQGTPAIEIGDQQRLGSLAAVYAQLAESDLVGGIAAKAGPPGTAVSAEPVTFTPGQFANPQVLPMIRVIGTSSTASEARAAARRASTTLRQYVSRAQAKNAIPASDRVVLQVLQDQASPQLIASPSLAVPLVLFVALSLLGFLAIVSRGSGVRARSSGVEGARSLRRAEAEADDVEPEPVEPEARPVSPREARLRAALVTRSSDLPSARDQPGQR